MIGDHIAIEVKSTKHVAPQMLGGIHALHEELPLKHRIVVCHERLPRHTPEGVWILPVEQFLHRLWADEFF